MITKSFELKDLFIWNAILIALFMGLICLMPQDEVQAKRMTIPGRRAGAGTRVVEVLVR